MGDFQTNIVASAVWSFFLFVLGFGARWIREEWRTRGPRRFWRPFLKGKNELAVVLTDKPGTEARSPGKISLTDVRAFSDVRSVLESLGRKVEIKMRSSADIGQLEKDSFVSIGGPKANGISEQVLLRLGDRLPVRCDATNGCFNFAGSSFNAAYDQAGLVIRDYGLIVRLLKLDNKSLSSKPALVVFGLHGHGTEQAVRAIHENAELSAQLEPFLNRDLFAFLMFKFENHKFLGWEIVGVNAIT